MTQQQLDNLLKHWGLWVRQGRTWPNTLGYPSSTVEARLGEGGGKSTRGPKVQIRITWDRAIEAADKAIHAMPPPLQGVIYAKYHRGMSVRDIAGALGIGRTEAGTRLGNAIHWLDGRLGA